MVGRGPQPRTARERAHHRDALGTLTAAGLVLEVEPGSYRYNPARGELAAVVDRLALAYAETRFAVVQTIMSAPNNQIRTFADAFRIKKD